MENLPGTEGAGYAGTVTEDCSRTGNGFCNRVFAGPGQEENYAGTGLWENGNENPPGQESKGLVAE